MRIIAFIIASSIFLLGGYVIYKNAKAEPLPESFGFVDFNAKQETKALFCPVRFETFEFVSDSTEQCQSISFGNFTPKEVCFTDYTFYAYLNPKVHQVKWRGKKIPTAAQLVRHQDFSVYFPKAQVLEVLNIDYDYKKCYWGDIFVSDKLTPSVVK